MTASQVFVGLSVILALAVACQVVAARLGVPAIIVLLPVGFLAGALIPSVNPDKLLGVAFEPLVSLAVAVILFDGGLDLVLHELSGHTGVVVRRLLTLGIPITWGGGALFAGLLFGMSTQVAVMLGAILIVSGPTVVGPLLHNAAPGRRLDVILTHEGTTIDPIGALIGVVVYQLVITHHAHGVALGLFGFCGRIVVGLVGAAVGLSVLWFLLKKVRLTGVLAAEAILATVLTTAGLCDAVAPDTGLVAAIAMGMVIANVAGADLPEDRRQLRRRPADHRAAVHLHLRHRHAGVPPGHGAAVDRVGRPSRAGRTSVVALVSTWGTDLSRQERIFVGAMHPRGIIAASTAASFAPPLVALGLGGADKLLPATFLVIVGTAATYGLGAKPLTRALGLGDPPSGAGPEAHASGD